MESLDYLRILRRGLPLIVVCGIMGALLALLTMPREREVAASTSYQAEAALLVAPNSTITPSYVLLYSEEDELATRVAEVLDYPGGPAAVAASVTVTKSETDPLILVTASGASSGEAVAELANTFAGELPLYIAEKEGSSAQAQAEALKKSLVEARSALNRAQRRFEARPGNVFREAELRAQTQRYETTLSQYIAVLGRVPGQSLSIYKTALPVTIRSGGFTIPVDIRSRVVLFGGLAVFLGVVAVFVIERVDPRMRRRVDMESSFGLATLAIVPKLPDEAGGQPPLAVRDPAAPQVDVFRGLRAALNSVIPTFLDPDQEGSVSGQRVIGNRVLLVTSAHSGAGVTTTVANLAATLADTGATTLAIDAHLRAPDLTAQLAGGYEGLADVLDRRAGTEDGPELRDVQVESRIPGVDVIGAGSAQVYRGSDPEVARTFVESARHNAEVAIIDGEPILEGVQSLDLLPFVDGVLIVTRSGRTTREDAARVASILAQLQAPCLGLIVVDAPAARGSWRERVFRRGSERAVGEPDPSLQPV